MKTRGLELIPLTELKGVGASLSGRLARLGLYTVQDLLLHLPLRYEDRTRIYPINALTPGLYAAVQGEVRHCELVFGRRRSLVCQITDNSGVLYLRFFTFTSTMKNNLHTGQKLWVYGEVRQGQYGAQMIHPEYQILSASKISKTSSTLTPVYPTTEGLRQSVLRKLTSEALNILNHCQLQELLPKPVSDNLYNLSQALHSLHRPPPDIAISALEQGKHPAQQRLILEELLAHHLSMRILRAGIRRHHAPALAPALALKQRFLAQLMFKPTHAQQRVIAEIEADLQQNKPMMRLVQGDVGCGKTLVAACCALSVIAAGKQVALMVPTELLAEQHSQTLGNWLTPLGIQVGWLTGKQSSKQRQQQLSAIASGEVAMIVGTHAIFQQQVQFQQLALAIIDEQHRFGVHQRLALWEKGQQQEQFPHQLIMTATPIPRTLAMTACADLDISIIDELPPGRTPVTTVAIADSRRQQVIERVQHACITAGRQAYWVCTVIDESQILALQAAEATCQELTAALPTLNIGLVHGRMKSKEKQAVMQAFSAGEINLLVATTVIEVGVDVPNASLMIIDNPERLGLAQLHQLRGRVGRGGIISHCVLLYKTPLSKTARARLQVLRDNNDGFVIAQKDLEIRGPGELLGTRQTGNVAFKVADLLRDQEMLPQVRQIADQMLQHHPEQSQALINRWLPKTERYSHV